MREFYVTLGAYTDDERTSFCKDIIRHNMHIKAESPDGEHCYQYAIMGEVTGYARLLEIVEKQGTTKVEGQYQILSLEHFWE